MRLLVIEDDPNLNQQLFDALSNEGYVVDRSYDGEEGLFLGETEPYGVAVLDFGLPIIDGLAVLSTWRKNGRDMPVLVLTARDRWSEKVEAFNAGADDHVTKPFVMEEVLARIRALIRRTSGSSNDISTCGDIRLDSRTGKVTVAGFPIRLTALEYRLLAFLFHRRGRIVSRSELVEQLYSQDFERNSNTVEVFIGRLRKKLGTKNIHTVRGLGYELTSEDEVV